jgi:hypothetical protein
VENVSPKLRGTLPAAARAKMVHHRGYSGGRGDDPHGVTQPTNKPDNDDQWLAGMEKHPDYDPNKSFFTKVED